MMKPLTGAILVAAPMAVLLLWVVTPDNRTSHPLNYTPDKMLMTTACWGNHPIYVAPDRSFWAWQDHWFRVTYSTGPTCHR